MSVSYAITFLAGVLTTLSPCVLPVLPIIVGGSVGRNKLAPLYIALGLILSFTFFGVLFSRLGNVFGVSSDSLRVFSALIFIFLGASFLIPALQNLISKLMGKLSEAGTLKSMKLDDSHFLGALGIGSLLGLIWSPCAGPTLGVAITLASQEQGLNQAIIMMLVYSLGSALPMILVAYLSRFFVGKFQAGLISTSEKSKKVFGVVIVAIGVLILTGFDKVIEIGLTKAMPDWLLDLTTRF